MSCCRTCGFDRQFDRALAARELEGYRKQGPVATTRALIDALVREGIQGLTLIDVGGGVGAVQHALLAAGVRQVWSVEASPAYQNAAKAEAQEQGHAHRIRFHLGDFTELAADVPPADIVTLDRVVCCYSDMETLVVLSAARARKLYGLVYPRDTWWVRVGVRLQNLFRRLWGNPFRTFVHSPQAIDALLRSFGLVLRTNARTFAWEVVVYTR